MAAFDSLLSTLSKGARAAYPFLRSLAATNRSAQSILDEIASQGISIRRQTGLDLIALLRDKGDITRFQRTFGENATIPGSLHRVAPLTFSGGAKYQYLVGTNSANPNIPEAIYVNSATPLTSNQIYGLAGSSFRYEQDSGMSSEDLTDVVFTIDDARYAPGEQLDNPDLPPPDFSI